MEVIVIIIIVVLVDSLSPKRKVASISVIGHPVALCFVVIYIIVVAVILGNSHREPGSKGMRVSLMVLEWVNERNCNGSLNAGFWSD